MLLQGFDADRRSRSAAIVVGIVFGAGLLYWGNRFKTLRRTTIILYGISAAARAGRRAGWSINHAAGLRRSLAAGGRPRRRPFGLFVLAGATPAALGLLADISERFPADRGAIMGLYSVFLAIGQISGALIGGVAADMRGHRWRCSSRRSALLLVALIPLAQLRRDEHYVTGPAGGCGVRRRSELRRPDERVQYCRSAGGRLRSHEAVTGLS